MATQQEQPAQPAALRKYERFVEQQLARAGGRVRGLDVAAAGLVLLIGTLLYALAVAVLDLCFDLPAGARLAALVGYAALAAAYVLGLLVLLLRRRVNPYYAARQLEKSLPDARGSVVNWLDLHGEPLPPAIRATLGARAARDLGRADVEEAIRSPRNLRLFVLLCGLLVGLFVLFLSGPGRFSSLLGRAFVPFAERSIPAETEIVLVQPEGGDVTVPVNHKVVFRVQLGGRVPAPGQPDSARLLYRYDRSGAYAELPLEPGPTDEWTLVFGPDQVQNGFWYRVAAGDARTPEYQVRVRSIPQAVRFDLRYHYRPYLRLPDRTEHFPNDRAVFPQIKDYRGTEVTLTVKTNRKLREARLAVEEGAEPREVAGRPLPEDPESARFRFVLDRPGTFRVLFRARDGEANSDRSPYPLDVIEDRPPAVVLDRPGKDVTLPANGTLRLQGSATDDIGIKRLTLRLRLTKGEQRPGLRPKVYREGKSFELAGGKYPDHMAYADFVALDGLKTDRGAAFPLRPGMELEYWLEAVDNCDYPNAGGNVGRSKRFKVAVGPPEDRKKQEQDRALAEQEQKRQEKKQDEELARQNEKAAQEQRAREEAAHGQDPARQARQKEDLRKKAEELQKALQGQQQDTKPAEARGAPQSSPRGAARPQGPPQSAQGGAARQKPKAGGQASARKDEGQQGQGRQAGQARGGPRQGEPRGEARGAGRQQPEAQARGGPQAGKGAQGSQGAAQARDEGTKKGSPGATPSQFKTSQDGQRPGAASTAKNESAPGQARGQEPAVAQGSPRQEGPGAGDQATQAKGQQQGGRPERQGAQAKDRGAPRREPGTAKGGGELGRQAVAEQIARLERNLAGDAKSREEARQELSRLRKEGASAELREAAGKVLDQMKQGKQPSGQGAGAKGQERQGQTARKEGGEAEGGKAGSPSARKGTQSELPGQGKQGRPGQQAGQPPGGTLGGGGGPPDQPRASRADAELARRLGDLHLDDLKKKLTPDVLKRANWTEKDAEQFLKDARAYEERLARERGKAGPDRLSGGPSRLAGSGARLVGPGARQLTDPLDSLHVGPPPEFRDALRRFSGSVPPPPVTRPGP